MNNKGYQDALDLGIKDLAAKSPEEVTFNTGTSYDGQTYIIPWFNENIPLEKGSTEEQIIWYHYLLGHGPKKSRNVYINYKQVPGAAIYNDNFIKRAINPMVKRFSNDLEGFLKRGLALGGVKENHGHMSFTLTPLPYVPLTFILWQGDDEIPANGNILFDESAAEWLCAEDLVVLASLPVYKMMKM